MDKNANKTNTLLDKSNESTNSLNHQVDQKRTPKRINRNNKSGLEKQMSKPRTRSGVKRTNTVSIKPINLDEVQPKEVVRKKVVRPEKAVDFKSLKENSSQKKILDVKAVEANKKTTQALNKVNEQKNSQHKRKVTENIVEETHKPIEITLDEENFNDSIKQTNLKEQKNSTKIETKIDEISAINSSKGQEKFLLVIRVIALCYILYYFLFSFLGLYNLITFDFSPQIRAVMVMYYLAYIAITIFLLKSKERSLYLMIVLIMMSKFVF